MTPEELHKLRVLYDMAKAVRRDPTTGKAYTDKDFGRDYLRSNSSMVSKVLSGGAVSKSTVQALEWFIVEHAVQIIAHQDSLGK